MKNNSDFGDVLIIGGAGHIGSHLAISLLKISSRVVVLDDLSNGDALRLPAEVNFIEGTAASVSDLFPHDSFSHIFHLGEYARVEQSFADMDKVFESNFGPLYSVLKFAASNGAKLIYSGSSTKFCDAGEAALSSPYAWTKKINSELVEVFATWFSLNYAICYFYNVYGGFEKADGKYATVIAKFVSAVESGATHLPVVRPGSQKRNFTHIDDVIEALILIGKYGQGDNHGIGSDHSYSILEIVELLGALPEMLPERPGNRNHGPVMSEKTKALGWSCNNDIADYIRSLDLKSTG
ncbi:NAD-dependent epimerase/dehydratase family protein [Alphaproteobacteria bacterium]|nr:NAD-dependent epimerase/dehydratase family protein [Alphaproteobacteria bacterium]